MKIVFLSNYFNHHQSAISDAFYRLTRGGYWFIETEPMERERINLGWDQDALSEYVIRGYENPDAEKRCKTLIMDADLVIHGSAARNWINDRLKSGKLTFFYSERWYKDGYSHYKWPWRMFLHHRLYGRYQNTYMLCASAYTAADCAKTMQFIDRVYKWGYFPQMRVYSSIDRSIAEKKPCSILWCARFLELKHPETMPRLARRLMDAGYSFDIDMIGIGEKMDETRKMIDRLNVGGHVHLLGAMSPDEVRTHMEAAQIFIFTSDFHEGWGAVVNEAMNSGCAVVASHAVGSTPYLIESGKNGIIYESGDENALFKGVKSLLDDPTLASALGKNANATIENLWNAETAAGRCIALAEAILEGQRTPGLYESGPCSKAEKLGNYWYKNEEYHSSSVSE